MDPERSKLVVPRHREPQVAVAVPTVRDPSRLRRCLRGALDVGAADGVTAELVVVLDGAEPDVVAFVEADVEGATLVSWPERRGLAAGLNAAVRATTCPTIVVLQDDAIPRPGWLRSLVATAARYPKAGAVGSLVLGPDGMLQSAGGIVLGDGSVWMRWRDQPWSLVSHTRVRAVDFLSSSSVLVKRAAWAAVGGFDEELYPAMYVDADFCTALWQAGWLVLLDPDSAVVHEHHGSTTRPFRDFLVRRNRARFLDKWKPFVAGRPTGPVTRRTVEEAVARSAPWVEDPPPVNPRPGVGPPVEDPPIVHLKRERDLLRAYAEHLEERLSAVEPTPRQLLRAAWARVAQQIRRLARPR